MSGSPRYPDTRPGITPCGGDIPVFDPDGSTIGISTCSDTGSISFPMGNDGTVLDRDGSFRIFTVSCAYSGGLVFLYLLL